MCDEWLESFAAFLEDMGPKPKGYSLDRVNVDGNYEPSNCRWASRIEQANNCRNNVRIAWRGETKPLQVWARELGVPWMRIYKRIYTRGWDIDRAMTQP